MFRWLWNLMTCSWLYQQAQLVTLLRSGKASNQHHGCPFVALKVCLDECCSIHRVLHEHQIVLLIIVISSLYALSGKLWFSIPGLSKFCTKNKLIAQKCMMMVVCLDILWPLCAFCMLKMFDDVAFLGGYASFECRNTGSTGNEYDTITRFVLLFLVLLQMWACLMRMHWFSACQGKGAWIVIILSLLLNRWFDIAATAWRPLYSWSRALLCGFIPGCNQGWIGGCHTPYFDWTFSRRFHFQHAQTCLLFHDVGGGAGFTRIFFPCTVKICNGCPVHIWDIWAISLSRSRKVNLAWCSVYRLNILRDGPRMQKSKLCDRIPWTTMGQCWMILGWKKCWTCSWPATWIPWLLVLDFPAFLQHSSWTSCLSLVISNFQLICWILSFFLLSLKGT